MANGNRLLFREFDFIFFSCKNFKHRGKIHLFVELCKNSSRLKSDKILIISYFRVILFYPAI